MTREQKADALLEAASIFQRQPYRDEERLRELGDDVEAVIDHVGDWSEDLPAWSDFWASAALSEVCHGMGFDLE